MFERSREGGKEANVPQHSGCGTPLLSWRWLEMDEAQDLEKHRTFLAWLRSALVTLGLGLAMLKVLLLCIALIASRHRAAFMVSETHPRTNFEEVSLMLLLCGTVILACGARRFYNHKGPEFPLVMISFIASGIVLTATCYSLYFDDRPL